MPYYLFFLLLLALPLSAQKMASEDTLVVTPRMLAEEPEELIAQFDTSRQSPYILYFPMRYARFIFTPEDKALINSLTDTIVERIDLVYTVFRQDKSFDQVKLNEDRYEMLHWFFPQAFKSNLIEWRLVAQDGAIDYATARTYFHGFVIYLKPHRLTAEDGSILRTVDDVRVDRPSSRLLPPEEEIAFIERTMDAALGKTAYKTVQDSTIEWVEKRTWTGKYLHSNPKKRKNGKRYKKKKGLFGKKRPKQYVTKKVKEVKLTERKVAYREPPSAASISEALEQLDSDTVVYKYLTEKAEDWSGHLIVQDVTGSMYPYITQTLIFIQSQAKMDSTKKYLFFNDGDDHPDGMLGRSGGTYFVGSPSPDRIKEVAFSAMKAGRGGRPSENDLEAVLAGLGRYPDCTGVLLIADNFARVRDMPLLRKIEKMGKKIDVLICETGKEGQVGVDYIRIASRTGGSIYTLEGEYLNLGDMQEGEILEIGPQRFRKSGKDFILLNP
ncbi:hypothetical protein [Saprospira grandis]|uniref:VWFA domain-containing protein n=1 Tax=Saprospira grandis (strain Lewin) TaxID=984262 RepID=H6L8W1_SAPGL|nr:hypothetical protein [Saprospira grandis]AFC26917.1 hypothetical protein SGRA_4202 [Saprospira grandis str. Lewin]